MRSGVRPSAGAAMLESTKESVAPNKSKPAASGTGALRDFCDSL
jgi:hypothetical protein